MVRLLRIVFSIALLAGLSWGIVGCTSNSPTEGKMGKDKMMDNKMADDKMGKDKMADADIDKLFVAKK